MSPLVFLAIPILLLVVALPMLRPRRRPDARRHVVIDGSNVMHWHEAGPGLEAVRAVVKAMSGRGFQAGVIFDANVGYKIADRYLDDRHLARLLGLPEDRVLVVPKGVPADQYILQAARDMAAPVVTNDRYRDWAETFPEVSAPGKLIRGGYRGGQIWLEP